MQGFSEIIASINAPINSFVWGPVMLVLLVGTGVWFSVKTGFFQVLNFGDVWKNTLGKIFKKRSKSDETGISPLAAMTTALAATVGTGNIVGVATAIVTGGPGAVFWMWISAFFGMMTKYAEVVLAVKYREKSPTGEWSGGPMYYIKNGLGAKWKWLATVFASFAVLASFGIGNLTQVNAISSSLLDSFGIPLMATGVILAILASLVIIGGIKRIGSVTEAIVPVMAAIYIIGSVIILIMNAKNIPAAFGSIFASAFSMQSVGGGVLGYAMMRGMRYGIARGVFSNEAGLGSAPIAHAATQEKDPVKQGMYGVIEVFIDTIVICSLTALVIISTGALSTGLQGAPLTNAAFSHGFGSMGGAFISISILFFAFSTLISWSYYGCKCTEYLFGVKAIIVYKVIFVACIFIGAFMELTLVWDIADTLNGLMAIPNLVALLGLSGVVFTLTKEYKDRQRNLK